MTRALPLQSSPPFLSYETFSMQMQSLPSSGTEFPGSQTPARRARLSGHNADSKHNTLSGKIRRQSKPSRPSYSKMIEEAVFEKCERRKGVSLVTIKKYLEQKYEVDVKKSAWRIRKTIRESSSDGGNLKQMTGSGARGSFVLLPNARKRLRTEREKSLAANLNETEIPAKKIKTHNVTKEGSQKIKKGNVSKADSRIKKQNVSKADSREIKQKDASKVNRKKVNNSLADSQENLTPVTRMRAK